MCAPQLIVEVKCKLTATLKVIIPHSGNLIFPLKSHMVFIIVALTFL